MNCFIQSSCICRYNIEINKVSEVLLFRGGGGEGANLRTSSVLLQTFPIVSDSAEGPLEVYCNRNEKSYFIR